MLIITGSMGAGKSSVLAEASDILALRHIVHAAIDLDALGLAHLPSAAATMALCIAILSLSAEIMLRLGVTRLLLARAMEDRAELELCRSIVSAANTTVCRLTASIADDAATRQNCANPGALQRQYVDRVAILDAILDRAALEDFVVVNENRSLSDVAQEMLIKAGWISS